MKKPIYEPIFLQPVQYILNIWKQVCIHEGVIKRARSWENLSLVICDQVRLKPVCSAAEAS